MMLGPSPIEARGPGRLWLLRRMSPSPLSGVPSGMRRWLGYLSLLAGLSAGPAGAADDVVRREVAGSDYRAAHEALIESVENEGLVVGSVLPFGEMLVRTAPAGRDSTGLP